MQAIILCGKMLGITQAKATVDLAMRNECLQMVNISPFLSPRLRSLLKRITGSQIRHVLTAWEAINKVHGEDQEQAENSDPEKMALLGKIAQHIEVPTAGWKSAYGTLTGIVEDGDKAELISKFGRVFSCEDGSGQDEAAALAKQLAGAWWKAIGTVLGWAGATACRKSGRLCRCSS